MRNIFLKKLCTKYGGETSSRPIYMLKIPKLSIYLDQQSEMVYGFFYCMSNLRTTNILQSADYLILLNGKVFENQKGTKISFTASFSAWFLKKSLSYFISYWLTKFYCLIAFTSWDVGQYMCYNYLFPSWWPHKLWN